MAGTIGRKKGRPSMQDFSRKSSGKPVSLTNGQWEVLDNAAEATGWTRSDLIREALKEYLPKHIRKGNDGLERLSSETDDSICELNISHMKELLEKAYREFEKYY